MKRREAQKELRDAGFRLLRRTGHREVWECDDETVYLDDHPDMGNKKHAIRNAIRRVKARRSGDSSIAAVLKNKSDIPLSRPLITPDVVQEFREHVEAGVAFANGQSVTCVKCPLGKRFVARDAGALAIHMQAAHGEEVDIQGIRKVEEVVKNEDKPAEPFDRKEAIAHARKFRHKYKHEDLIPVRKTISKLYQKGYKPREIVELLKQDGYKTPRGTDPEYNFVKGQIETIQRQRERVGLPIMRQRKETGAHHTINIDDLDDGFLQEESPPAAPEPEPRVVAPVAEAPPVVVPPPPTPPPAPPRVVVAPTAPTPSVPISVLLMLEEPSFSDAKKMKVLQAMVGRLPAALALTLDDGELSDSEKLSLVKVLLLEKEDK